MEKVKRFFRNLNEKRSYQIVVFVVSMCLILGIYAGLSIKISIEKSHEYTIVEDKYLVKYIEDVKIEGEKLLISGWCFYRNVDSAGNRAQIFLRNVEDEEDIIWLDTEMVEREDVNAYYGGTVDYRNSGFKASTKLSKLDVNNKDYEIFVKLTCVENVTDLIDGGIVEKEAVRTVVTKRYICEGKLSVFKPESMKNPVKTASEKLNEVFDRGVLLVYREDYDVYVYQYGKKLYWVAGEEFYLEEDGLTYLEYQLDTTKPSQLPTKRIENNWDWDNRGFYFEKNELKEENTFPYRVAECDIPTTYPVTCFWTGYHVGTWVWREDINLNISYFDENGR